MSYYEILQKAFMNIPFCHSFTYLCLDYRLDTMATTPFGNQRLCTLAVQFQNRQIYSEPANTSGAIVYLFSILVILLSLFVDVCVCILPFGFIQAITSTLCMDFKIIWHMCCP